MIKGNNVYDAFSLKTETNVAGMIPPLVVLAQFRNKNNVFHNTNTL